MNPYDNAHELARTIRNSDAAQRVKAAKDRIEQDPSTLKMLNDYRHREWELETKLIDGQELTSEEEDSMRKLGDIVRMNKDVTDYLEAERQLTVMIIDIQDILSKALEDLLLEHPGQSD